MQDGGAAVIDAKPDAIERVPPAPRQTGCRRRRSVITSAMSRPSRRSGRAFGTRHQTGDRR